MTRIRATPPNRDIHYRTVAIRASGDDNDAAGFSGYASHFGSVDSYGTAIQKGAFRKTLNERGGRIPVLWQHWSDSPIGKPTELKEDDTGLWFDAEIVEATTQGADAMALLRAGVPLGMSFGFETIKSRPYEESDEDDLDWSDAPTWAKDPDGREFVRVIEEVRLWEISLVTFPANEQATIDDIRAAAQLDLITRLTEDVRAGRIADDDARHSQLQSLIAACTERAEAGASDEATTPLAPTPPRRRNRYAEASLLMAELGIPTWRDG